MAKRKSGRRGMPAWARKQLRDLDRILSELRLAENILARADVWNPDAMKILGDAAGRERVAARLVLLHYRLPLIVRAVETLLASVRPMLDGETWLRKQLATLVPLA